MPSSIKLTYFDVRGRTEISRLILAYAGVDYQDERLTGQTANIQFLNFCNLVLITKPLFVEKNMILLMTNVPISHCMK